MKLIKNFKTNLLTNVKLIKIKFFKINHYKIFNHLKFELKKNLKIIFKFFLYKKKILFLGVGRELNNFVFNLIKNTKHSFLNNSIWFNGILTNSNVVFKFLVMSQNLNKIIKFLFNLNRVNLIVLLNQTINIFELLQLKIVNVAFFYNSFFDYKFNFYYRSIVNNYLVYFFLNALKLKIKNLLNQNV